MKSLALVGEALATSLSKLHSIAVVHGDININNVVISCINPLTISFIDLATWGTCANLLSSPGCLLYNPKFGEDTTFEERNYSANLKF